METKTKLAVCIPWSSEFGWMRSMRSITRLQHPEGCEVDFFYPDYDDGWCSARRHNAVLEQALAWGADLICFMGADQVYHDRDILCRLVGHWKAGCDALTVLVPTRGKVPGQDERAYEMVGWQAKPDEHGNVAIRPGMAKTDFRRISKADGPLVRVHAGGTGVLMFPAKVLKQMLPPWFMEWPRYPTFARRSSADSTIMARLQLEAGLQIWCDTTIKVTHAQVMEIDETFAGRFDESVVRA